MMEIENLVEKIKQKKELSGIDDSVISEQIEQYTRKNRLHLEDLTFQQLKIIIKDIRSILRENVGRFQASTKDRKKMLENGNINALLKTHSSTRERMDFYPQLKAIIKKLDVNSILDLGCGINPIALAEKGTKYYASDINLDDLNLVKMFFQKNKLNGEVFVCDLNKIESCSLPEAELCLVLKVFDILGKKDYESARRVLERIKSKHLIVSFSTKTLSGKPMNSPRRIWFEKLIESFFYKYEIIKSSNEIFYII